MLGAVHHRFPDEAEELVKWNGEIEGKFDQHKVDVVLENGSLLAAIHGLSFEVNDTEHMEKEVDVIAWAIDDIKKKRPRLPLAVYVLPPPTNSKLSPTFNKATRVFKGLKADVVRTGPTMDKWAKTCAASLAA